MSPVRRRAAKAKPFWWFQGASVQELTARLQADTNVRLEVHLAGDKMTLEVVSNDATAARINPPINDSHICPPQCP